MFLFSYKDTNIFIYILANDLKKIIYYHYYYLDR